MLASAQAVMSRAFSPPAQASRLCCQRTIFQDPLSLRAHRFFFRVFSVFPGVKTPGYFQEVPPGLWNAAASFSATLGNRLYSRIPSGRRERVGMVRKQRLKPKAKEFFSSTFVRNWI